MVAYRSLAGAQFSAKLLERLGVVRGSVEQRQNILHATVARSACTLLQSRGPPYRRRARVGGACVTSRGGAGGLAALSASAGTSPFAEPPTGCGKPPSAPPPLTSLSPPLASSSSGRGGALGAAALGAPARSRPLLAPSARAGRSPRPLAPSARAAQGEQLGELEGQRPPARLRGEHHRRRRQGLSAKEAARGRRRATGREGELALRGRCVRGRARSRLAQLFGVPPPPERCCPFKPGSLVLLRQAAHIEGPSSCCLSCPCAHDTTTPRAPRASLRAPRSARLALRAAPRLARTGIKTLALAGALARSLSLACGALSLSRSRSLPRPCHQCLISASVCVCVRLSLPRRRLTTRRLARCCAHSSRPEPVGAFSTTRI